MTSTPLDLSSPAFSMNPGRCFWEQVGVKAPGTAKRMVFLAVVRAEIVVVWSSFEESRYERVASGSLEPVVMAAVTVVVERERGFGRGEGLRVREKGGVSEWWRKWWLFLKKNLGTVVVTVERERRRDIVVVVTVERDMVVVVVVDRVRISVVIFGE